MAESAESMTTYVMDSAKDAEEALSPERVNDKETTNDVPQIDCPTPEICSRKEFCEGYCARAAPIDRTSDDLWGDGLMPEINFRRTPFRLHTEDAMDLTWAQDV